MKFASLPAAVLLTLGLSACGDDSADDQDTGATQGTTAQPTSGDDDAETSEGDDDAGSDDDGTSGDDDGTSGDATTDTAATDRDLAREIGVAAFTALDTVELETGGVPFELDNEGQMGPWTIKAWTENGVVEAKVSEDGSEILSMETEDDDLDEDERALLSEFSISENSLSLAIQELSVFNDGAPDEVELEKIDDRWVWVVDGLDGTQLHVGVTDNQIQEAR